MYQPPIAGAYARRLVGVKMKYAFELLAGKIVHRFENGGSNLHSVKSLAHLGMDEIDWVQVWLRHGSVMLRSAAQDSDGHVWRVSIEVQEFVWKKSPTPTRCPILLYVQRCIDGGVGIRSFWRRPFLAVMVSS